MNEYLSIKRTSAHLLKIFRDSVKEYVKKLTNPEQERKRYYELGKQTHMSLLEPQRFNEMYLLSEFDQDLTPSTEQQKLFCYGFMAFEAEEESKHASTIYEKLYKTERKSPKKVSEEALALYERFTPYIKYLRELNTGKIVLPKNLADTLKEAKTTILNHKKANELLAISEIEYADNKIKAYNELVILWEFKGKECIVECKSMLDRIIVDTENKIIKLIDLKTTATLKNFKETVSDFGYDLQLAFYWLAITYWFKQEFKDEDMSKYKQETYIVALKTTGVIECKVYSFSTSYLNSAISETVNLIHELSWHITNDRWDYTREYYEGEGVEIINQ